MEVNFWISRIYYYCGAALARPDDAGGSYMQEFSFEYGKYQKTNNMLNLMKP